MVEHLPNKREALSSNTRVMTKNYVHNLYAQKYKHWFLKSSKKPAVEHYLEPKLLLRLRPEDGLSP
jgi:hypothetical protein